MKKILFLLLISSYLVMLPNVWAEQEEDSVEQISQRYHEAGSADAREIAQKFEEAYKPRYQKAYDNYLADLEIIRATGTAADDENLYNDLRKMSNSDVFVYSESKRGIEQFRGNAFR